MKLIVSLIISIFLFCSNVEPQNIESNIRTERQKADTLFNLASGCFKKGKFDSARYFLNAGFDIAKRSNDQGLIGKYIILQCYIHLLREEFEVGLVNLGLMPQYLRTTASYELHRKYLLLKGRFNEKLQRNDSALYYYQQLEQLNNLHDPYENWLTYSYIAHLYKASDAYYTAEQYYQKAYVLTKSKGIRMHHIPLLSEFADLYYQWRKPEKFASLMYEQQQLVESRKKDYSNDPVHSMLFIDQKRRSLEDKVTFMKKVKSELKNQGHLLKAALANNYIAGFFEDANQPDSALRYIRQNQNAFKAVNDLDNLYSNTAIAYRLLKKAGRYDEATREADKLFALKDSIIKLQNRKIMLELGTKYETGKKENAIVLLNAENELNAIRLEKETGLKEAFMRENFLKDSIVNAEKIYNKLLANENSLRAYQLKNEKELKASIFRENILKENELVKEKRTKWLLISGGFLLFVFGLIIFLMYRRQKSKNLLIQKQADDLQMLMKEIHHRVKNNLQVISSLLDLQSLTIGDKHASEAIRESRNRVYSMALIHQNLYREESLRGIDMGGYINKLVESLLQSYHSGSHKIQLETDVDPLLLDIDMVIPIGLVLNELISNSLKYAFNKSGTGTLLIALKKTEDELLLKVHDNGSGFPSGLNVWQTKSFGYKLIKAFAQKLKARLEVYNDNGACILLHIKKIKFA